MDVILSQFQCFIDQFPDKADQQIINDITSTLAKNLSKTSEPQSFSLVNLSMFAKDPSIKGAKIDALVNQSSIDNLYYNMTLNIMRENQTDFQPNQTLFYQPSVSHCIKVIPSTCVFQYSTDDSYERVCDSYSQNGKILVDSIIKLSVTTLTNPNELLDKIQLCRKNNIKTFSLPFQCTVANTVMDNADVMKALLAEKERLEKKYKEEKVDATVEIDTVTNTLKVVQREIARELYSTITKEEAGTSGKK